MAPRRSELPARTPPVPEDQPRQLPGDLEGGRTDVSRLRRRILRASVVPGRRDCPFSLVAAHGDAEHEWPAAPAGIRILLLTLHKDPKRMARQSPEDPIRADLFGIERLEQHAESLAAAQVVMRQSRRGRRLLQRVEHNGRVLRESYRVIANAIREERAITPAAEWLVDNFHVVDEQLREIRDDLPSGFYRELPKLVAAPLAGYPRVYGIAWAFVAHTDSRLDPESLRSFVRAYQRVQPLTIGELWAVAITLRIVLVENLRRAAARIVSSRAARQEADTLADRLLGVNGYTAEPDALLRRDADRESFSPAFTVQLLQRLRDQDPRVTPALHWLEELLAAQGTTSDEIVRDE